MTFFYKSIFKAGLIFSLMAILPAGQKTFAFPQVIEWKNKPIIVYDNKTQVVLKKDLLLKSPFAVVTSEKDQLEFKINILDKVVVYANTKVQIPEFANESGFVTDFYILDGRVRFSSNFRGIKKEIEEEKKDQFVTLRTPFFEIYTSGIYDIVISLDMKEPSVEVKVISGILPLAYFAYEKTLNLQAGESVKFKGVTAIDGSGIQYDYLLNNRKVPKGVLLETKKFDASSFVEKEKNLKLLELKKIKEDKKKAQLKIKKQKEYEESFLCQKPFGQKDQCAWWQETGKCFRKRCNVSGRWGDIDERPLNLECKKEFTVKECDY